MMNKNAPLPRNSVAHSLLIAIIFGFTSGCNTYQVEWSFNKRQDWDSESTPLVSESIRPELLTRATRWTTWETLHNQINRAIRQATIGDNMPLSLLNDCKESLLRLEEHYERSSEIFLLAQGVYTDLILEKELKSKSSTLAQLQQAKKALSVLQR